MKKIIAILLTTLTLSCCNKEDKENKIIPPATQTGAGTFSCLVNDQPFVDTSGGYFNCFYQFTGGEYYFGIQGSDRVGMFTSVGLGTDQKQIEQGITYQLVEPTNRNANGGVGISQNVSSGTVSFTNSQYTGELKITKLDFTNKIVSGTFWFDVKNPYTNETVQIRNGQFDTLFTQ